MNQNLTLDVLDDPTVDALASVGDVNEDFDPAFAAPASYEGRSFLPTEAAAEVVAETVAESATVAVATKAPKAKAAAKPKAAKAPAKAKTEPKAPAKVKPEPKVVEAAEVTEEPKERPYVGLNNFDHIEATGKTAAESLWTELLTNGEVTVSLTAEMNRIMESAKAQREISALMVEKSLNEKEARAEVRADYLSALRNRLGQRLTQPYQAWYPNEGKGTGVFIYAHEGSKTRITYDDNTRPPRLVTSTQRPSMVGKVALAMLANGATFGKCGVTAKSVKALAEAMEEATKATDKA